eukprot:COSAG04_NODE_2474_length_4061_cov_26.333173_1_plen_121_part_10
MDIFPPSFRRSSVLLFKLMQSCWVHEMDDRPQAPQLLKAVQAIRATDGALDDATTDTAEPEPEPEPSPEQQGLLGWLTAHGLEEHEDTIGNYVSESTELPDLRGMLVAEQEDEEEEDLKDL